MLPLRFKIFFKKKSSFLKKKNKKTKNIFFLFQQFQQRFQIKKNQKHFLFTKFFSFNFSFKKD